jgi:hypothetical protein
MVPEWSYPAPCMQPFGPQWRISGTIPLGAVALALVVKAIWLAIEFNDKEDRGDDIGIAIVLIAFLVIIASTYFRRPAASSAPTST